MLKRIASLPPIVRKATVYVPLRAGGLLLQFVTSIVVARAVGAEMFGAYTYAFVWAVLIGSFLTLGLEQLTVREVPYYLERGETGRLVGFVGTTIATLLVMAALAGVILAWLEAQGLVTLAPGWLLVALLALVHAAILAFASFMTGLHYITTAQVTEAIPRGLIFLGLIAGIIWAGGALDPTRLFQLSVASAILPLAVMIWITWGAARHRIGALPRPEFATRHWYVASIPVAISALSQLARENTDILMIGAMLGDFETGIYRAAARGAFLASFASLIAIRVLGPMLSRAVAAEDRAEARQLLAYAAAFSAVLGLGVCGGLALLTDLYLSLFGPDFLAAGGAMRILLLGRAFDVLTAAAALVLIINHRERLVLWANLGGLAANIALNYWLIALIGIEGAAIGASLTTVAVNGTMLVAALRVTGLDPTVIGALRLYREKRLAGPR